MSGYSLNETQSAWEIVDGEAVAVSTDTSAYYSLNHTGAAVLVALLQSAWDVGRVAGTLSSRYAKPLSDVTADVQELMRQLVTERLLVNGDGVPAGPNTSRLLTTAAPLPEAYEVPWLTRHGELSTLILSAE
jgi:hypothetical protein